MSGGPSLREFGDYELVVFTERRYGADAAHRLDEILSADPEYQSGFANFLRRSFEREALEAEFDIDAAADE